MFDNFTLIFGEPDSFDINPNSEEYDNSQQKVTPILSLNIEVYYGKIPSRVYWNCVKWDCKYVGERECMVSEKMVYFWDFLDLSEYHMAAWVFIYLFCGKQWLENQYISKCQYEYIRIDMSLNRPIQIHANLLKINFVLNQFLVKSISA